MQTYKDFSEELRTYILKIENTFNSMCCEIINEKKLYVEGNGCELEIDFFRMYQDEFFSNELAEHVFSKGYQSFISLYICSKKHPDCGDHLFIPIWDCTTRFFRKRGILYEEDTKPIQKEIEEFITEFIDYEE